MECQGKINGRIADEACWRRSQHGKCDKQHPGRDVLQQGNLDAVINAGQIWMAGCQAITKTMAASAKTQLDQARSNWNTLISVKSLQEMLSLPASFSHKSYETAFAETGRLTDASIKLTKETMAPITARVMLVVEKFQHPTPDPNKPKAVTIVQVAHRP